MDRKEVVQTEGAALPPPTSFTYIYGLVDPNTLSIRYVGKSNNPYIRLARHMNRARKPERLSHVVNWLRNLTCYPILIILECVKFEDWKSAEKTWISALREKFDLTNSTLGGDGFGIVLGWVKEKISRGLKGKTRGKKRGPQSEETKRKISVANKGRIPWIKGRRLTIEHKQKIGNANRGRKVIILESTRKKISTTLSGKSPRVNYLPRTEEWNRHISEGLKRSYSEGRR